MPAPLRPRLHDTNSGKVFLPFSFVTTEDGEMKRCHSFAVEPMLPCWMVATEEALEEKLPRGQEQAKNN